MFVLGVSIVLLEFGTVQTVWFTFILFFILITDICDAIFMLKNKCYRHERSKYDHL